MALLMAPMSMTLANVNDFEKIDSDEITVLSDTLSDEIGGDNLVSYEDGKVEQFEKEDEEGVICIDGECLEVSNVN